MSISDNAIARMRSPRDMHIICVDITNKCDLHCSNCTRLLENQDGFWDMTPENFRLALRSLKDYPGIIAMIGGNPCMHRNFEELCVIFCEEIPRRIQRGLWTNNYFKHREVIEETFGTFNLNAHGETKAADELTDLAIKMKAIPETIVWNYREHSSHSPILTAVKDLYGESEMWEKIVGCDINREWSASIVENKGQLRYYFCEVAASFDLARGEDNGRELHDGWWKQTISDLSDQVKHFCPSCGVPAKQKASMDYAEEDTYTVSNEAIATKDKKRKVIMLTPDQKVNVVRRTTQYGTLT